MSEPRGIQKLTQAVINRIAAGEIIQRPANAIKELIENSLDANATNVQVTVKNGGLKYIQISDDGCGIRKEDFEIVCERFTTSKLREYEDLNSIATYGFRGEALASISHVAHLTIQSKTANEKCAYRASYSDGKLKEAPKSVAGNQGTQISIEDLFYNMNVRKRALKSATEEYQKISDVIGKYAIHNASVGFALKKYGENNDIRTPSNSNHVDNIRTIYGNIIARELIEFDLQNKPFKFKAHGFITNVNYSTKKFIFLLFINNRLVECQSLKKCIDQIYTMYLPKNMHPFVYLSLDLDPRDVDVNVHPTKHEVHFLYEDQIIEMVTTALETKLLGSNNSRMYFTQAKLPGVVTETVLNKSTDNKPYDKDLVRTDSSEQKLEKFFGATVKKSEQNTNQTDIQQENNDLLLKMEDFEKKLTVDETNESQKNKEKQSNKPTPSDLSKMSFLSKSTVVLCKLKSVLELQKEIQDNCHMALREVFAQHVFVGVIDPSQALIQHGTKLYHCNTQKIMEELFYQFIMFNFQNFNIISFSDPLPIFQLTCMALDLPDAGWTEEDGDKAELARKVAELLTEKGEMLKEYFSMEIDDRGHLKSLPILIENHVPETAQLPMYLLRLATEVDWEQEKPCFKSFARETAFYYSQLNSENTIESKSWQWTVEHLFYPAIKTYFMPPKSFTENAAILQIADLPNLYKVFERC